MPQMYAVAGQRIYIGNNTVTDQDTAFIESDFASQSWTEIKGWVQVGGFGSAATLVTSEQVPGTFVKKAKGMRNSGSMVNQFDVVAGDTGQAALKTAEAADSNYAFKVVYPLRTGQSTPTTFYLVGLVMDRAFQGGQPNNPNRFQSTVEIQNNIVEVAAS